MQLLTTLVTNGSVNDSSRSHLRSRPGRVSAEGGRGRRGQSEPARWAGERWLREAVARRRPSNIKKRLLSKRLASTFLDNVFQEPITSERLFQKLVLLIS